MRADGSRKQQQFIQSEPGECGLAAPADEFAANAMARIHSGLVNHHRHIALPQPDAQGQAREPAADNPDGLTRVHGSRNFPGDKQMAEGAGAVFRELPVRFVGPEGGEFAARKARAHADLGIVTGDSIATNRA